MAQADRPTWQRRAFSTPEPSGLLSLRGRSALVRIAAPASRL